MMVGNSNRRDSGGDSTVLANISLQSVWSTWFCREAEVHWSELLGSRPLSGVYLPAPFRVAVSTVLGIYRWLKAPI
jgi:hypothetical protein